MALSPERRQMLNSGECASTTLSEILAVDFARLMSAAVPEISCESLQIMETAASSGILRRMERAADLLARDPGPDVLPRLAAHPSDTVRGWACFLLGRQPDLHLSERIKRLLPYAADEHFGVREWAWLALRPHIQNHLDESIRRMSALTGDGSERIRRFASESLRPRGVWCTHLERLKADPEPGLAVLEPLRADPSRYVQDSVANWLNDASKTQPDWVRAVCARWATESPVPETTRICRRALRSVDAKKPPGEA